MEPEASPQYEERIDRLERTLAAATEEVAGLRRKLDETHSAGEPIDMDACLTTLDAMGLLATSEEADDLLDTIVEVAAKTIGAEAGSLLLEDEDGEHLIFGAVHGEKADELREFRIKLGQGIAGFVAASGQPLCVADVARSEQWDPSISEAIQFKTQSILAVPALAGERTVGVLEVVNKADGGEFEQSDIELLSRFAKIAGAAVERRAMASLSASMLATLKDQASDHEAGLASRLKAALESLQASETHKQALQLATEIERLCATSTDAAAFCQQVLHAASAHLAKRESMFGLRQSAGDLSW